jgi:hypothetical protein
MAVRIELRNYHASSVGLVSGPAQLTRSVALLPAVVYGGL